MPRVPLLQQSVQTPMGANDAYQQTQQVPTADAQLMQQVAGAAQNIGGAIDKYQFMQARQQSNVAAAWTANAASDAALTWQKNLQDRKLNSEPGAPDFTKNVVSDFDSYEQAQLSLAPDDQSRQFLTKRLAALRTSVASEAMTFEGQQRIQYQENQFKQATDNATALTFNDPSQKDTALHDVLGPLDGMQLPGTMKQQLAYQATQAVNLAAAASVARSNPSAIVGQPGDGATASSPGQYQGGFQGADAFVAQKEGGAVANDNGHGPTNYGINQQANPDIDVKNLTPEQAAQVRKSRYWDAIHGDALPPAMQPVAYNFAIQAGAGAANNLIQQAGGDAAKFNDLAKRYYAAIPPDKANGNTAMWQQRSDDALRAGQSSGTPADNQYLAGLPWQSRVQVFNQAKAQQAQDMSQWRARIEGRMQDAQAQATQGVSDPIPLPMGVLLRAYPPDIAAQKYQQYQDGQQLARDVSSLKGMPNDQIGSLVQARAPMAGPGYAQAQHDQQILGAAAAHIIQQRNADPGAWVANNSIAVQTANQAYQQNPTPQTAQAFAQASVAEQQRLGIAKPQILSKAQAASIEDTFKANDGSNAYDLIQQQAQMWGPQWGTVFSQLKGIPAVAKTLGYLGDSIDPATGKQIALNAVAKPDDLKAGLLSTDVKAAEQTLQSKSKDFAGTMAYSVGGAQTYGALYDAAERLSWTYMRQGQSASDAASNAFNNVMGKQFNVVGSARIPAQYDQSQVMKSAQGVMDGLGSMDLQTPPAPKTMTAADAKAQYTSNLKSNAKWITSADGTGLVLFDPVSQSVVRTRDGKTVGGSFADLSAKPQVAAPVASDPSPYLPGVM